MRRKSLFVLVFILYSCYLVNSIPEVEYQTEFLSYLRKHSKSYNPEELHQRYTIFKKNLDFIHEHNRDPSKHRVAINKFADLSVEEFQALYTGLKKPYRLGRQKPESLLEVNREALEDLPTSFDWRKKNAVTPVKNQGACGSCWAFSTTGSVEGCHQSVTGNKLVSLSEKNLMDCSWDVGNQGCGGGLMNLAFEYIIKNNGIVSEDSYPYDPISSHVCKYKSSESVATIGGFKQIPEGDEKALLQAVAMGPTSIAIDAANPSFQFYAEGVYSEPLCDPDHLDHGVLAVGWGQFNGTDYWLVKNSWGEDWGKEGYILMARNKHNHCGVASMASIPTKCT